MLGINLNGVDATTEGKPGAGGYIIELTRVTNNPQKQYIEVEYDIDDGPFKGYYTDLCARHGFWGGSFRKYYTKKALRFFYGWLQTIEDNNGGAPGLIVEVTDDDGKVQKNVDESKLVGCRIGYIYGMEEYIGDDGRIKTRVDNFNAKFVGLDVIRGGRYEVPEFKPLEKAPEGTGVIDTTSEMPAGFMESADDTPF